MLDRSRARVLRRGRASSATDRRPSAISNETMISAGTRGPGRGDTAATPRRARASAMVHASGTSDVDVRERTNERATARAREERERERDAATTTGAGD